MPRARQFHGRAGRGCLVCQHKDRARIEQGRVAGVSLDNLARKFGVSRDSIHRHWTSHVGDDLKAQYLLETPLKDLAARASEEGVGLIEYFAVIRAALMQQFQLAVSCNDRNGAAILAGRLNEILNSLGKLTGEILKAPAVQNVTNTVNNFIASPLFMDLQQMLIRRLANHPEAMAEVVAGLRELEARSAPQPMAPLTIEHREAAHA
jgi:hypothetical protein